MAPTVQNVKFIGPEFNQNIRLIDKSDNLKDGENFENNNTVHKHDITEEKNIDFNKELAKYEAMKFTPRIRWPDLIVQVSLHLVTMYGFYLILIGEVMFLTTIFGKNYV